MSQIKILHNENHICSVFIKESKKYFKKELREKNSFFYSIKQYLDDFIIKMITFKNYDAIIIKKVPYNLKIKFEIETLEIWSSYSISTPKIYSKNKNVFISEFIDGEDLYSIFLKDMNFNIYKSFLSEFNKIIKIYKKTKNKKVLHSDFGFANVLYSKKKEKIFLFDPENTINESISEDLVLPSYILYCTHNFFFQIEEEDIEKLLFDFFNNIRDKKLLIKINSICKKNLFLDIYQFFKTRKARSLIKNKKHYKYTSYNYRTKVIQKILRKILKE